MFINRDHGKCTIASQFLRKTVRTLCIFAVSIALSQVSLSADAPVVIPNVKGNATTTKFGDGSISRSTGGASVTSSKFGSGYISRESGSSKEKDKGVVRVIPAGKRE